MVTAGLGPQVLIFGIGGLWLLALIPAAIITALKGEWLMFAAGWLTLGLVWIIAAASLAPPDSWWARVCTAKRSSRVLPIQFATHGRVPP